MKFIVVAKEKDYDSTSKRSIMYVEGEFDMLKQAVGKALRTGESVEIYKHVEWDVFEKKGDKV